MTLPRAIRRFLLVALTFCASSTIAQDSLETIKIVSDSAIITFSLNGAYPVGWDIIDPEFVEAEEKVPLIHEGKDTDTFPYPFRLILDGKDGELTQFANTSRYTYEELKPDGEGITHAFTSPLHPSGLRITKHFVFNDRFRMTLSIIFTNTKPGSTIDFAKTTITLGAGLGRIPGSIGGLGDSMYTYVEAVGFGEDDLTPFKLTEDAPEIRFPRNGATLDWVGIHNRYYLMAMIPDSETSLSGQVYLPMKILSDLDFSADTFEFFPEIVLDLRLPDTLQYDETRVLRFDIYAGPKDPVSLQHAGENLEAIMYYSLPNWMRWLTFQLGHLLNAINGVVHAWWVTLLVLVVIVRILLFPMAQKAIKMNEQMLADQAKLKPLIDAVKEKHKDPNVQYQKTMALYKEHGIHPMAPMLGCIPVLLQLPILIAIFNLLGQEVKMQGATFLWVSDLSIPDQLFALPFTLPYFGSYFNLLPLLMSVTMVLTTNMGTTAVGDQKKSQMRSMTILAFIFFALFYSFPAGLVLYWMMSNIGQYIQQEIMARRMR